MTTDLRLLQTEATVNIATGSARLIRVLLADNHATMRHSLRMALDGEDDIQVVTEAADLQTVMRHLHQDEPHVLVLDLGMHDGSSIDVIRHLRRQVVGPEIVVLTTEDSPAFARRAFDAGATGFVLKDRAASDLAQAVRAAAHRTSARFAGGGDVARLGSICPLRETIQALAVPPPSPQVEGDAGDRDPGVGAQRTL